MSPPEHESSAPPPTAGGFPAVPTTKILAIGCFVAPLTPEQRQAILPHEVTDTVQMYLAGKIDQWWYRQDGKGPVFLMNVTTVEEADALLESLPLGVAKLLKFELLPLGPLRPLHQLLKKSPTT